MKHCKLGVLVVQLATIARQGDGVNVVTKAESIAVIYSLKWSTESLRSRLTELLHSPYPSHVSGSEHVDRPPSSPTCTATLIYKEMCSLHPGLATSSLLVGPSPSSYLAVSEMFQLRFPQSFAGHDLESLTAGTPTPRRIIRFGAPHSIVLGLLSINFHNSWRFITSLSPRREEVIRNADLFNVERQPAASD